MHLVGMRIRCASSSEMIIKKRRNPLKINLAVVDGERRLNRGHRRVTGEARFGETPYGNLATWKLQKAGVRG